MVLCENADGESRVEAAHILLVHLSSGNSRFCQSFTSSQEVNQEVVECMKCSMCSRVYELESFVFCVLSVVCSF
jgi:hypothetical protein